MDLTLLFRGSPHWIFGRSVILKRASRVVIVDSVMYSLLCQKSQTFERVSKGVILRPAFVGFRANSDRNISSKPRWRVVNFSMATSSSGVKFRLIRWSVKSFAILLFLFLVFGVMLLNSKLHLAVWSGVPALSGAISSSVISKLHLADRSGVPELSEANCSSDVAFPFVCFKFRHFSFSAMNEIKLT